MDIPDDVQAACQLVANFVVNRRSVLSLACQTANGRSAAVLVCFPEDNGSRAQQTVVALRSTLRAAGKTEALNDVHFEVAT